MKSRNLCAVFISCVILFAVNVEGTKYQEIPQSRKEQHLISLSTCKNETVANADGYERENPAMCQKVLLFLMSCLGKPEEVTPQERPYEVLITDSGKRVILIPASETTKWSSKWSSKN